MASQGTLQEAPYSSMDPLHVTFVGLEGKFLGGEEPLLIGVISLWLFINSTSTSNFDMTVFLE